MDLQHEFNYNDPLELTEIFRVRGEGEPKEYGGKILVNWEDIKLIKEYPYPDDWKDYHGEKYSLSLHNYASDILILGNFNAICKQYIRFRNQYPIFNPED